MDRHRELSPHQVLSGNALKKCKPDENRHQRPIAPNAARGMGLGWFSPKRSKSVHYKDTVDGNASTVIGQKYEGAIN